MNRILTISTILSIPLVSACKESKKESEAQPAIQGEPSSDTSYEKTLDELKASCRATPQFSHFGRQGDTDVPYYSGYAPSHSFQIELSIIADCPIPYEDQELAELVGETNVNQLKAALATWAREQDWFASRRIEASFEQNVLELVQSEKAAGIRWNLVFATRGSGDVSVSLKTSDQIAIDAYPIVVAGYSDESIASGAELFANRSLSEGTCAGCHQNDEIAPALDGKYLSACSDAETVGAIQAGTYSSGSGYCSGQQVSETLPHAFSGSLTQAETLDLIAWIRSQN